MGSKAREADGAAAVRTPRPSHRAAAEPAPTAEQLAELNNELALVVAWTELLAGRLGPGEERAMADRARRAAWAAAGIAQHLRRELGESR